MSDNIPYNTYSHNFGIIIPQETGVSFTHQSGGMSCTQIDLEGVFLPLSNPSKSLGYPEWVGLEDDISEIDLSRDEIPNRDFNSFPEWVQERGNFYNQEEFNNWLNQDSVYWYGRLDLMKEQRLMAYDPSGEMLEESHGYNPCEKWDSYNQVWEEINKTLPFTYEVFDAYEYKHNIHEESETDYENIELPIPDDKYPVHGAAFKWIKIIGSKQDSHGRKRAEWADELAGEYVIMTFENCD